MFSQFNVITSESNNLSSNKTIKTMSGYRLDTNRRNVNCYAGGADLIAENEDECRDLCLPYLINQWTFWYEQFYNKIKPWRCNETVRFKTMVYEEKTEQAVEFSYHGLLMTSSGRLEEANVQIMKINWVAGCTNDLLWNNKCMRIHFKWRVYNTVIRPMLTYLAEVRSKTFKTKSKFNIRTESSEIK